MPTKNNPSSRLKWRTLALMVGLAIAVGLGTAWWAVRRTGSLGAQVGAWRVSTLAGGANADMYTRARVAVGGLLALNREETMYYLAQEDSQGRPLRARCTYRIFGQAPAARWWSITAYAQDYFLFDNPAKRYSFSSGNLKLDDQGRFSFVSAPQALVPVMETAGHAKASPPPSLGLTQSGSSGGGMDAWLPTPGDSGLLFTLRVYNPSPALAASPGQLNAPTIERQGVCS